MSCPDQEENWAPGIKPVSLSGTRKSIRRWQVKHTVSFVPVMQREWVEEPPGGTVDEYHRTTGGEHGVAHLKSL